MKVIWEKVATRKYSCVFFIPSYSIRTFNMRTYYCQLFKPS